MRTAIDNSRLIHHIVTLLFGAALAAGLWLMGYAEVAWLGFAAAAIHAQGARGCRPSARSSQRSTT